MKSEIKKKPLSMAKAIKAKMVEPKLGIFWYLKEKDILWGTVNRLSAGEVNFHHIEAKDFHFIYWAEKVKRLPVRYRQYEHDEIPRGRISYSKEDNVFIVKMSHVLHTKEIKAKINERFSLAGQTISYATCADYNNNLREKML